MRKFFFCRNNDEGERRGNNCEGKPTPNDLVASEGRRNIGNVGNEFGNVQHGNRLNKTLRRISSIGWGDGEVPGGIGTCPVDSMCLTDPSLVRRCFVRRL